MPQAMEKIAIFEYTLTLKNGETRNCHAMSYQQDGAWWHFDDLDGTVLTIRHELIDEVTRGQQVGEQEVEAL